IQFNRASYTTRLLAAPSAKDFRSGTGTDIVLEPIEQNFDHQALEAELLERLEPRTNRFVSRPADCAELAAMIPDGGLLIEYWRCTWPGDQGPAAWYVALVLPKDRPDKASIVPLCESAVLEDTLLDYLAFLSGRNKAADFGTVQEVRQEPEKAREL